MQTLIRLAIQGWWVLGFVGDLLSFVDVLWMLYADLRLFSSSSLSSGPSLFTNLGLFSSLMLSSSLLLSSNLVSPSWLVRPHTWPELAPRQGRPEVLSGVGPRWPDLAMCNQHCVARKLDA